MKQVPSPNHSAGRQGAKPVAIVLHTMGGSLTGCDSWFANPASEVSAHYGVGLGGDVHQYVDLKDTAWANGILEPGHTWPWAAEANPNRLTVSIETEDKNNSAQDVTDAQYRATLAVGRLICRTYPSITHLVSHAVISPGSRKNCCGPRWIASGRFAQLAVDLGLEALG